MPGKPTINSSGRQPDNRDSTASKVKPAVAADRLKHYLLSKCKSGTWSYGSGEQPSLEATAWAAIVLREQVGIADSAADFIVANQNADGGWSTGPHEGHSDWVTALSLLALRSMLASNGALKISKKTIDRGMNYLLDSRTEFFNLPSRVFIGAVKGAEGLKYPRGWPWTNECFHWVEPTSYSLLALKVPELPKQRDFVEAVKQANEFLVFNNCSVGGWNHGSHYCLNVNLPPYIVTTCEALIALQDLPDSKSVLDGLAFLDRQSEATEAGQASTVMALSWLTIARHCYGKSSPKTVERLIERQNADGSLGPNLMVSSLALLALDCDTGANPFKISWTNPETRPGEKKSGA